MTPLLLTYCALALPYLAATVRLALTVSVWPRSGVKSLP
jgi:hypothetical protein